MRGALERGEAAPLAFPARFETVSSQCTHDEIWFTRLRQLRVFPQALVGKLQDMAGIDRTFEQRILADGGWLEQYDRTVLLRPFRQRDGRR